MKSKFIFVFFFLCVLNARSQNYYLANPQGYGAGVTGGGNATPVTVSTFAALKLALPSTSTNKVILISGTIDCGYWSVLMTNVSIIGLPGAKLRNLQITVGNSATSAANSGLLYVKPGSKNVIIRNIIFEGPGAYDVDGKDNLTNEGTNVWVDHCEFQDGMDGNFDNKGAADNVTVSWCKFTYLKPSIPGGSGGSNDHRFSNLVGSAATDAPIDGHYSITFQSCYWAEGCKERMPRARNAELHLLNCYYNSSVGSSLSIGLGGGIKNTTCYVENTNFAKITKVYNITSYLSDGGTIGLSFSGCLNQSDLALGTSVAKPSYATTVIPIADVAKYVTDSGCGAGATLQVTNSGVITPSTCLNLSIGERSPTAVPFYASLNKNTVSLHFFDLSVNTINVDLFELSGKKVFSLYKEVINSDRSLDFSVENLSKGIYFCNVNYNNKVGNWKFVKN
jgi:pectate lyase